MKKVIVLLAPGFEETEAVTVIDLLRRAEIEVLTVGLTKGAVCGSHNISIISDAHIEEVDPREYDMLILPGGQPGSTNLKNHPLVIDWLQKSAAAGKKIAAICAAPTVLQQAGVISGKKITSYPAEKDVFTESEYKEEAVVKDNLVITSRGVGTAIAFSLEIIAELTTRGKAEEIAQRILYTY